MGRLVPVEACAVVPPGVSRFGGQPDWLCEPCWPVSAELGVPMRFIAQIRLPQAAGAAARLAYVFLTDEDEEYVDTFEADGGENAVIVQPGGVAPVDHEPLVSGPTLCDREGHPVCFLLETDPLPATAPVPEPGPDQPQDAPEAEQLTDLPAVQVGGTPTWLQGEETPAGDWRLLAQIDSTQVPFWINFGDAGIGYVFLDTTLTRGCLLWQGA
ncbi:MAG: DUF1963 domain-containing protein [Actinomycetales bacterium]|nr:DUF1963 domain-containing protein [Actinomycetales bacterium]